MFEEETKRMLRGVFRTLTENGHFSSKREALERLKDSQWIEERGYGHIGRHLQGAIGAEECGKFFDELDAKSMKRLTQGIHEFQSKAFHSQKELFERLSETQSPDVLFVTCSDSRIVPNLITQTNPGELFIIRNAGNIIPPFGVAACGEAATIEFALLHLAIRDIIVCGHAACGAMKALVQPEVLEGMPMMAEWLKYASGTRQILDDVYVNASVAERIDIAVQENVLVQLENLRTHPSVAAGLAAGKLNLHGWVYQIGTGEVFAYYPELGQFLPISSRAKVSSALAKSSALKSI